MTPEATHRGAQFDLAAIETELRQDEAYTRAGHAARTLVREPDLRVVLVLVAAGRRIAEHRADETASIQLLRGAVRLKLPDRAVALAAGHLLVLEKGLRHDVEADADSAFLLTLGWNRRD